MPVREILLLGNPALRAPCASVKNFPESGVAACAEDLRDTLAAFRASHGFGRGIAAPQIDCSLRMIFIDIDSPLLLINPRIIRRSRRMMTLWDDCFSFPDILVKLKRNATISVSYRDAEGARHRLEAAGDLSELLQHEIDHIDGILAIDRAIDSRHIILRIEYEKLRRHTKEHVQL